MIAIVVKIAVMVPVPLVIVLDAAMVAFPIARKKLPAIVMRANPVSPLVGRPAPISFMPAIMTAIRIPIPVHPKIARPGSGGPDCHNPRRRRRSDANANANLSA